jgi:hypothetical protein
MRYYHGVVTRRSNALAWQRTYVRTREAVDTSPGNMSGSVCVKLLD